MTSVAPVMPLMDVLALRSDTSPHLESYNNAELAAYLPVLMERGFLSQLSGTRLRDVGGSDVVLLKGYLGVDMASVLRNATVDVFDDEERAANSGLMMENASANSGAQLSIVLQCIRCASKRKLEVLENPYFHADFTIALCVLLRRLPDSELSLQQTISSLIRSRGCLDIVLAIVRNIPERFPECITTLLSVCVKHPDGAQALHRISELSPWCALCVRDALLHAQVLPDLTLHLTLHGTRDVLDFCAASLRMECSWIRLHFQAHQERENTPAARMRGFLLHAVDECQGANTYKLAQLLHLYCGLCGMWGLRVSPGSSQRILTAISTHCTSNPHIAEQGLCFLLVCEGLCKIAPPEAISQCVIALAKSVMAPLALLVGSRFSNRNLALNAQWAKSVAGIPVSIHSESLQTLANVWRDIFSEEALAAQVLTMEPVKGLRDGMTAGEDVVVLAMKEMLVGQVFLRFNLNPGAWIVAQLENLELPLHRSVAELIDSFVWCTVTTSQPNALAPLTEDMISALVARYDRPIVRLAVAYFVLSHNHACVTSPRGVAPYARGLVESLALKALLLQCEADAKFQAGTSAALLSLVTALCVSEHPELLCDELGLDSHQEPLVAAWMMEEQSGVAWDPLRLHLERLGALSDAKLLASAAEVFGDILGQVLAAPVPSSLDCQIVFAFLWRRLHRMDPVGSTLAFLSKMRVHHNDPLSSALLIADPLLVLRVQRCVFQSPPVCAMLLESLNNFVSASRQKIRLAAERTADASVREGLGKLVLAQDTAVAQLSIEILVASELLEVQLLICRYLHQLWIQNPATLHLLHHQSYAFSAVEILVQHCPSMHVCIDFLPQLLEQNQSRQQRRVWAMHLLSHIVVKYPTAQSLDLASRTLRALGDVSHSAPAELSKFLLSVAPSIRRILIAFPVLLDEFVVVSHRVWGAEGGETFFRQCVDVFDLP